jgi:Ca2+-binding RTX toxin-like protein
VAIITANGTSGADTFTATTDDDYVYSGLGGDDTITTLGGADTIRGGGGNDTISTGAGDDTIVYSGSGEGFDSVDGGAGTDRIIANANGTRIGLTSVTGVETISANGFSNVSIVGSGLADNLDLSGVKLDGITQIDLNGGNDTLVGSAGADTIIGNGGDDLLSGGGGDDLFLFAGNSGRDTIDGGSGYDTVRATAANAVLNWGSLSNVEEVSSGGFANVRILGAGANDVINLTGVIVTGIDAIDGGAGADSITGSSGADNILGNTGDDTLRGGGGNDTISGGTGNDTIVYAGTGEGYDSIDGGIGGADRIIAAANGTRIGLTAISGIEAISANGFGNVSIVGSGFADNLDLSGATLTGITQIDLGGGNDTLVGSAGADTIIGNGGDDLLSGGGGDDVFLFAGNSGRDTIDGGTGYDTLRATAANATLNWGSLSNVEEISGGGFANVRIVGAGANDFIDLRGIAVSGIDAIDGGAGADVIIGSDGADTIIGNTGNDFLSGQGGDDVFLLAGGAGTDTIDGGAGYDVIRASSDFGLLTWGNITGTEEISGAIRIGGGNGDDLIDLSGITLVGVTSIDGGGGADIITGSAGADTIIGGAGADLLAGGEGGDTFRYDALSQSQSSTGVDRITDFVTGTDRINLSAIDANAVLAGAQAFTFIGDAAFSGTRGELQATIVGGDTYVSGDVDGNMVVDFQILLTGTQTLTSADFIL